MDTKMCPFCGGEMLKGKTNLYGHARYFWVKPWAGFFSMSVNAHPWLCIRCGAVLPYVEEQELEKIRREYERQRIG
ncbi:hypothetical protein [Geoglobus acetivorans]|uniref:YgiT-type zinc finger protein n=1 Tax=Geoglobus acetivorans TaxID=565033 RepID=A0ABZ3H2Z9_GEOAI|nr:hypothetical protein [Geoglobus acetivorans]